MMTNYQKITRVQQAQCYLQANKLTISTFIQIIINSYLLMDRETIKKKVSRKKNYSEEECDMFQKSINTDFVQKVWKAFRENGASYQGKIPKNVGFNYQSFKKTFTQRLNIHNELFIQALFESSIIQQGFKIQKAQDKQKSQKQEADLHDLVISLTILSRMGYEQKLKLIFYLTDIDEDGCLSVEQISKMINRIEYNFCKENSYAKITSSSLLHQNAYKKAQRTFKSVLEQLKSNIKQHRGQSDGLITYDQFIQAIKKNSLLYQKFLPNTYSLYNILVNIDNQNNLNRQGLIVIKQEYKERFLQFRKQIHLTLRNNFNDSYSNSYKNQINGIKYPGKIQVLKDGKEVQIVNSFEKNPQKRGNAKLFSKRKVKQGKLQQKKQERVNEQRQQKQMQHKQILQKNRVRLRKMLQMKNDPRFNIHFDNIVRN